ncbi:MAG: hypothetical protein HQK66_06400 [Desulfamplus sp.]|nr:hypothetical protein [Desulfamplus sp.]
MARYGDISGGTPSGVSSDTSLDIARVDSPDPCFDDIWEKLSIYYPLAVVRNSPYMAWRFFDHPMKRYQIWVLGEVGKEGKDSASALGSPENPSVAPMENQATGSPLGCLNNPMGYAVIQEREHGRGAVMVDMLMPPSHAKVGAFMEKLCQKLGQRGIHTLETWLPRDHFLTDIFAECGFQRGDEPIGIIPTVRLFDSGLDMDAVCRDFYYTMGDGDLF